MRIVARIVRSVRVTLLTLTLSARTLDLSLDPLVTISKARAYKWTPLRIAGVAAQVLLAAFWFTIMQFPPFPLKLGIPLLWIIALALPVTSQFFVPATPVFMWLLTFYSSRFIPPNYRPQISVSLLPTLESVLYGNNISDILTRFTHPILDILAWLPYGVLHFTLPAVVAACFWLFRHKAALQFWAHCFGYMNLTGVIIQIILPCAPPWYELIYGLTPADYSMPGSPGGLHRVDKIFHNHTYTVAFGGAPVVFGAFPSLHAGNSTLIALFVSHFFPQHRTKAWIYAGILYWSTMYLTHHYLIDVVAGACLATGFFYATIPPNVKGKLASERSAAFNAARQAFGISTGRSAWAKHEQYDLESRPVNGGFRPSLSSSSSRSSIDATPFPLSSIRSPTNPESGSSRFPTSSAAASASRSKQKSHRHTASIASLIRADDRVEEGWSPVVSDFASSSTANAIRGNKSDTINTTILEEKSKGSRSPGKAY
ncbi:Aureobasidin resistance protein Aur1 [Tulasnella sp. 419]|nr:Aureobasidin resistance protein Aur1 [Tulasnella sp. 418]KAG8962409.1 Aureobasidin resistance protein Aur1 [Tulasnella sp. 419]